MSLVLDTRGLSAQAGQRARLEPPACAVLLAAPTPSQPPDAVVAAVAGARPDGVVLTSDPLDLRALAEHAASPISIVGV